MGRGTRSADRGVGEFQVLALIGEAGDGVCFRPDPAVYVALAVVLALEPATEHGMVGAAAASLGVEHGHVGSRFPLPCEFPLLDLGVDLSLFGGVVFALGELLAAFFNKCPVLDGAQGFLKQGFQEVNSARVFI